MIERPRRLRQSPVLRSLVAETRLHPRDLVLPVFVAEGIDEPRPIASMPGVDQHTLQSVVEVARRCVAAGLGGIMLFGVPLEKDATGSGGIAADGILNLALRAVRDAVGDDLVVMADTCLDEFTDHGHCGVLDEQGRVDNDATNELYAAMAVAQARAGAHVVAPSGMMDGQVAVIREALDAEGLTDTVILAYSAKYASAFFGPFREAVQSSLEGDRRTYQQDPANIVESLRDVLPRRRRRSSRAGVRAGRGLPGVGRVLHDPGGRGQRLDRPAGRGDRVAHLHPPGGRAGRAHLLRPRRGGLDGLRPLPSGLVAGGDMAGTGDDGVQWLTDAEQASWRAILRGTRLLERALDDALGDAGLQLSEYEIISMLSESPHHRLRMSELAAMVVQSRSRLTHTAKRLEDRGWVTREQCADDRRGVELVLTTGGLTAVGEIARVHVQSVRDNLVDIMSPKEFTAIGDAMAIVRDHLDPNGTSDR